jgi:hypothetical protein
MINPSQYMIRFLLGYESVGKSVYAMRLSRFEGRTVVIVFATRYGYIKWSEEESSYIHRVVHGETYLANVTHMVGYHVKPEYFDVSSDHPCINSWRVTYLDPIFNNGDSLVLPEEISIVDFLLHLDDYDADFVVMMFAPNRRSPRSFRKVNRLTYIKPGVPGSITGM